MRKSKTKYYFKLLINQYYLIMFLFSLVFSYTVGLIFYDITNGLDFNRYINNLNLFLGKEYFIFDSQGTIYFYIIAKYILFLKNHLEITEIFLNNVVQFCNFLFYCLGLFGLYKYLNNLNFNKNSILLSFTVLNFFPVGYYLRLTMKPEIMAFTLLPWLLYYFEKYLNEKKYIYILISSFLLSLLLTLKASIFGMSLLCIIFYFFDDIKRPMLHLKLIIHSFLITLSILVLNYFVTSRWLFEQPFQNVEVLKNKWNNTANLEFFFRLDLYNLIANPYKHNHSDSFIAITLLDTLGDYFTFFWNHNESGNYFFVDRIMLSENFLIQMFIQQYISIIFTFFFYLISIYLLFLNFEKFKVLTFPFLGMLILIVNSFGFPSKNFDPETGDLFKVHYYSFLIIISFCFLLNHILKNIRYSQYFLILLIPVFLITIGFPKYPNDERKIDSENRLSNSEICILIKQVYEIDCKYF